MPPCRGSSAKLPIRTFSQPAHCSIGIGWPNRWPWKARQPFWRRMSYCAWDSTSSAITPSPSAWLVARMAASLASSVRPRTKQRSISSWSRGRRLVERSVAGAEVVEREADAVLAAATGYTMFETISPSGILSCALIYGPGLALLWVLLFEVFHSRRFWCRTC